jgi:hypothetical protein
VTSNRILIVILSWNIAIIRRMLDSVGFTNYQFFYSDEDKSIITPKYWWSDGTNTVWANIQELCRDTQLTAVLGEDNILTTNSTQTLPSTSGLTIGSRVTVKKYSSVQATIQVNNIATEQIRLGNNSIDAANYDSILYNSNRDLHFTWTGTVWECNY